MEIIDAAKSLKEYLIGHPADDLFAVAIKPSKQTIVVYRTNHVGYDGIPKKWEGYDVEVIQSGLMELC